MKPLRDIDPEILTVLEIVQHTGEILSRLPLAVVRGYLTAACHANPDATWYPSAERMVLAAEAFELANASLAGEEYRAPDALPRKMDIPDVYPDDSLPSL